MSKGTFLGEFEMFVLGAVLRLSGDAYGVTIRQEIERRTGRAASTGAVYATLDRLAEKGLVSAAGAHVAGSPACPTFLPT